MKPLYIHQHSEWPRFKYDLAALALPLAALRRAQGELLGRFKQLELPLLNEISLISLTDETVASSAIELEHLDERQVRSSLALRLGVDEGGVGSTRHIDGIVEMMLDAIQNHAAPLSEERLFKWHEALFPRSRGGVREIAVGAWRSRAGSAMRVVSGAIGSEIVHFEAPIDERVAHEMDLFLRWFNGSAGDDALIHAAIAHLYFVTIHPFEDGNGRIARAITELALARADAMPQRFYSLSRQIEADKKSYYAMLERCQRGDLDITTWILWFLHTLQRAISQSEIRLAKVLAKAAMWQKLAQRPVNERQRMVLMRLHDNFEGFLTTSKYGVICKCSADTALRDITQLVEWGVLVRNNGGGRSTSYRLVPLV